MTAKRATDSYVSARECTKKVEAHFLILSHIQSYISFLAFLVLGITLWEAQVNTFNSRHLIKYNVIEKKSMKPHVPDPLKFPLQWTNRYFLPRLRWLIDEKSDKSVSAKLRHRSRWWLRKIYWDIFPRSWSVFVQEEMKSLVEGSYYIAFLRSIVVIGIVCSTVCRGPISWRTVTDNNVLM